jgi:hypothetical protein
LEVYSEYDVERLKDSVEENWSLLVVSDGSTKKNEQSELEDSIYFATEKDIERERLLEEMNSNKSKKIQLSIQDDDEEIDIDTI